MSFASKRIMLLCIGDELLDGRCSDLNARELGSVCTQQGWNLCEVRFAPDDEGTLTSVVAELVNTADVVVTSGGLGSTGDDRTRGAIA